MKSKVLYIHALSPLHAGTGQAIGAVDLPIARSRATEHPYVPGTSLKGSLRDKANDIFNDAKKVAQIFGPESDIASDYAGAVAFGDANVLVLPVRSISGTFAWISSPYILRKFIRDIKDSGVEITDTVPNISAIENCIVHSNSTLCLKLNNHSKVIFEDLDVNPTKGTADHLIQTFASQIFPHDEEWRGMFLEKFCLVSDDIFTFLSKHGTDVVTRIRIEEETKVVKSGALWTEENLPAETLLYANVVTVPNKASGKDDDTLFSDLSELYKTSVQLGGKATVGRGRCKLYFGGA